MSTMLDIFTSLFDLIAPPPEPVILLRPEKPETFVRFIKIDQVPPVVVLASYHTPLIHAAITANKFHNYPPAAKLLSALLEKWLSTLPEKETYLIPIPLGSKRARERGYNQVTRVLESATKQEIKVAELLKRVRETAPQTSLNRSERLTNIKGVFALKSQTELKTNARYIICDDVLTTGATLKEARATLVPLLPKGSELLCVALAH